ncbi:uroporphyrinogen decarboxylase [Dacryopinax primogenitus]|uniref:Uroporphyrinogen decarboxylase n=1 Tax=Dacryopinax primogenitus (strain DJM 731) TaxID=1858805 RepID=M5G6W6_DACPD|nr:uroporphyrinogen decarboxylase [Dacryopinax primogenitus]EJU05996.1 uroporphyrinogen decarboxylase [Dacryopinax primogenitus]
MVEATAQSLTGNDFPPLKNDLILRAARGERTERAPVWVMRQAGRYLPEFRKVREKHAFFDICQTPALATEITLQPIRRYAGLLDAAIIFSDILVIPQAMGMIVEMPEGKGPTFPHPLADPEDLSRLKHPVNVDQELGYVFDAITMTRKELKGEVPLIGFCGSPWTLMAYMIQGGGSRGGFHSAKRWIFQYPTASKELLSRITTICVDFLIGQVRAGAQLVQVFDSWASELSPHDFQEFSLPYLCIIAHRVKSGLSEVGMEPVPMILFAKGANYALEELAITGGYDVLGLDWCIDPLVARHLVGDSVALQGNIDPDILYGGKEAIQREVKRMCASFRSNTTDGPKGWIANLGHGITPGVSTEDMGHFLSCVHKYSRQGDEVV